ncbi:MAG TPA: hypothetical protein PKN33_03845 [Phycisphaerae bacterium]|nr:hypothetical protein [Phycisphaerae bacterium]
MSEINTNSGFALYYPYLHIQDVDWLKWALLYWEGIRRIVPASAEPGLSDSHEARIASGAGLLMNTSPQPYVDGASKRFEKSVVPLLKRDPKSKIEDCKHIGLELAMESADVSPHLDKMTGHLANSLRNDGLAEEFGPWLRIQNGGGGLYMVCLGAEMGVSMGTPLVTDTAEFSVGGEYLLYGEPPNKAQQSTVQPLLIQLGVEFPALKALRGISMKRIVAFHQKRAAERRRFRIAIDAVANTVAKLDDANALADYLSDKKAELQEAVSDHKKSMDELSVTSFVSALDIKVPSMVAGGVALGKINKTAGAILIGTGLSLGAIQWWAKYRSERRKIVKSCAWHYCLSARRAFPRI